MKKFDVVWLNDEGTEIKCIPAEGELSKTIGLPIQEHSLEDRLLVVKEKYNLDFLDLYCAKDTLDDFATDNFLRLMIGKNNRYNMRDMEDRIITDKVFKGLMEMIPEMIIKLNEIIPEDEDEKQ